MNAPEMRIVDLFATMFVRRKIAFENNTCVACAKPAHEFRDELSAREWKISALCQICQDEVFAEPEEDDEE
jgi:hypothetical protein